MPSSSIGSSSCPSYPAGGTEPAGSPALYKKNDTARSTQDIDALNAYEPDGDTFYKKRVPAAGTNYTIDNNAALQLDKGAANVYQKDGNTFRSATVKDQTAGITQYTVDESGSASLNASSLNAYSRSSDGNTFTKASVSCPASSGTGASCPECPACDDLAADERKMMVTTNEGPKLDDFVTLIGTRKGTSWSSATHGGKLGKNDNGNVIFKFYNKTKGSSDTFYYSYLYRSGQGRMTVSELDDVRYGDTVWRSVSGVWYPYILNRMNYSPAEPAFVKGYAIMGSIGDKVLHKTAPYFASGGTLQDASVDTELKCANACDVDNTCKGFSFHAVGGGQGRKCKLFQEDMTALNLTESSTNTDHNVFYVKNSQIGGGSGGGGQSPLGGEKPGTAITFTPFGGGSPTRAVLFEHGGDAYVRTDVLNNGAPYVSVKYRALMAISSKKPVPFSEFIDNRQVKIPANAKYYLEFWYSTSYGNDGTPRVTMMDNPKMYLTASGTSTSNPGRFVFSLASGQSSGASATPAQPDPASFCGQGTTESGGKCVPDVDANQLYNSNADRDLAKVYLGDGVRLDGNKLRYLGDDDIVAILAENDFTFQGNNGYAQAMGHYNGDVHLVRKRDAGRIFKKSDNPIKGGDIDALYVAPGYKILFKRNARGRVGKRLNEKDSGLYRNGIIDDIKKCDEYEVRKVGQDFTLN